jgi:hypothetical protein
MGKRYGRAAEINYAVFSVRAKEINFDCMYFQRGNEWFQRYCYLPDNIIQQQNEQSFLLSGCKGCQFYEEHTIESAR